MKTKLLTFAALLIAAVSMSVIFNAAPVQAKGEKYEWVNKDTIRASGGLYENVNAADDGVINFPRKGSTFEIFSEGSCDITMTISVSIDNKNGTLVTEGCDDAAKDFDRSFTIANPEKGPPLDGSEVDYNTVNCSTYYEGGLNVNRCEAVKKCIQDENGTKEECLSAWASCMVANGDQGTQAYTTCREKIGSGDLSDSAPPEDQTAEKTTCVIAGIGWIVCPIVNFLSLIVDAAYGFVASLLVVQPLVTTGEAKGIYDAWSIMRNFANVAFVISFLVIIFSQLTSVGITNYGIKKLLPRLIMAAILVNISFWICAIAVDVSNILGSSIKGLFDSIGAQLELPKGGAFSGGGGWTVLSGGILAGTAVAAGAAALYIGLSALLPALIVALLAILTVFIVLTLRQALIILLIIVAPLAFVAYLLPNTEGWFNKWRGLLQTLLLMYPIIAAIFGASALASQIVMGTASGTYKMPIQIMGALIAIAPLALTPIIMKTAGGVLGRVGAIVNNPNKGPFDRMRKGAEGYRKNRQMLRDARGLSGGPRFGKSLVQRKARRGAVLAQRERNLNNARSGYIADASLSSDVSKTQAALNAVSGGRLGGNTKGDQLLDQMAQGGGPGARSAALSQALQVQQKLEAEEVTAASATIKALNLTRDQKRELASGGSIEKNGQTLDASSSLAMKRAAMQSVVDSNDIKGINNLVDQSRTWDAGNPDTEKLRQSLADSLSSSANRPAYIGQSALQNIREGNAKSSSEMIEGAIANNTYSAEKIAKTDKDELHVVAEMAVSSTNVTTADKQKLVDNAHTALTDPQLARTIGKNIDNVVRLRDHTAPPPGDLT